MAHAPSLLFAPLYLAIDKGYFRELGIDVQLEAVTAGQDAAALTAAGQLDATVAGFAVATFNGIQRGLDLRIVASMAKQPLQGIPSPLMVRKDLIESGQVKTVADLKGRKVGIAGGNGSTGSYYLAVKLREAGLTLNDVEIVNLAFPDQVTGLRQMAIDAAYPPAPFSTQVLDEGLGEVFGGPTAPGQSGTGVLFGGQFVKNRPEVAVGVLMALVRGARDLQGGGFYAPENLAIFSRYTRLPVETLRAIEAYEWDPNLRPDVKTLLDMQSVFIQNGLLRYSPPLTAERLVDEALLDQALQRLGSR